MRLQTVVEIKRSLSTINFADRGLVVGSCFAQNIGKRLNNLAFDVAYNPFGVMYNPISVAQTIQNIKTKRQFTEADLIQHDGLWHSMDHHGEFSGSNQKEVLERINQTVKNEFDYIIVTLGTAWVYQFKGKVVANCHKIHPDRFTRKRLTVNESVEALEMIVNAYHNAKIILTLSPIRHIKDGAEENSLSKAILRCAIDEVCQKYKNCVYFPAFEIVNDQLRDYRFYDQDMLHPSQVAIEYVLQRFEEAFLDEETQKYVEQIEKLLQLVNHRPLQEDSESYANFVVNTKRKIDDAKKTYKHLEDLKIFSNFGQF